MKKLVNIFEASKNFHRGMTKKSQNSQDLTDLNDRTINAILFEDVLETTSRSISSSPSHYVLKTS